MILLSGMACTQIQSILTDQFPCYGDNDFILPIDADCESMYIRIF